MKIFGKNAVKEALLSETVTAHRLFVVENYHGTEIKDIENLARRKGVRVQFVGRKVIETVAGELTHQGVMLEVDDFKYCEVEEILLLAKQKNEDVFLLILDGITDPHNLGAILRSAECAGVHGVIIGKNRSVAVNETVIKVSAGATSNIKVAKVTNISQTIEELKKQNIFVFALELGGTNAYKTNLTGNIAIVIGSEGEGVHRLVKETCDGVITLPQKGKINSLNASVASGIIIYEVLRQKECKK